MLKNILHEHIGECEMGNQQPSDLTGIETLARNAKFGDGHLWRHPECVNYKCIFTSTDRELLLKKISIAPHMFPSGVALYREQGATTNYCTNSKALYRIASLVHPVFTLYKAMSVEEALSKMTLFDFALWYLDDGSYIKRKPRGHRFMIHIGSAATGETRKEAFMRRVHELFDGVPSRGGTDGHIVKNNSKATENNMTWKMPIPYGMCLIDMLREFHVMPHKFPEVEGSETILNRSTATGVSGGKRRQLHQQL